MNSLSKRQVNFNKLKHYIYKRGKQAIIVLIIAMLIGAIFSVVSKKAVVVTGINTTLQNVQNAKASLSESEASYVDSAYKSYVNLADQKKKYQDYIDKSILLHLDSEKSTGKKLIYLISGNKKAEAIRNAYQSSLVTNVLCNKISAQFSDKPNIDYIKDIINAKAVDSPTNNSISIQEINDASSIISVVIWARNDSECSIMTKEVKARMNTLTANYEKSFGNYSIKLINESVDKISNSDLVANKNTANTNLTNVVSSISTIESSLSETQRNYFDALVAAGENTTGTSTPVSSISPKLVVTYAIGIGLIIFILYLILIIIRYLMSSKLHYALEMEKMFGINLIAVQDQENDEDQVSKDLEYYVSHFGKTIGLTSTLDTSEVQELMKKLSEINGVKIIPNKLITDDDFKKLSNISEMVLIEENEVSDIRKINEIIEYFNKKDIKFNGSIIIDK